MSWPCWSFSVKSGALSPIANVMRPWCQQPLTSPSGVPVGGVGVVSAFGLVSAVGLVRVARGLARVAVLVVVLEVLLEHLAGRVARQLVEEDDLARHLVAGEVVLDVLFQGVLVDVAVLDHERP